MAFSGYLILKFLALMAFWLCLSGKTDPLHIWLGLLSVFFVLALTHQKKHRDQSAENLRSRIRFFWSLLIYTPWLCYQILMAALHVSFLVLSPDMPINPGIIRHKTILKKKRDFVIFGNSITLTPGTITTDLEDDVFVVHQLDADSAGGIIDHSMEQKILAVFGGGAN